MLAGCTIQESSTGSGEADGGSRGDDGKVIRIDGSSTVYPVTKAVAEEFPKSQPGVRVVVGLSGTGGGFTQFAAGDIDISNASRPIDESEAAACAENGVEFLELKVATDGLSVVVNPANTWCECLSVDQLRQIWESGSQVKRWSDIDPDWPEEELVLYGADTDSGTFDYFTEEICGEVGNSRSDYTPSAEDNVLVRGVAGDRHSLGYFGYAYYVENTDKLKLVGVSSEEGGAHCVVPTPETVESGQYVPLSRPLFLYVNKASLKRPEVVAFLQYFLDHGQELASEIGYVKLSPPQREEMQQRLEKAAAH